MYYSRPDFLSIPHWGSVWARDSQVPPWDNKLIAVIGGGAIGCGLSLTLANQANHVLTFEALDNAAGDVEPISRFDLLDRIEKDTRVQLMCGTPRIRVMGKEIEYREKKGRSQRRKVDQNIWATGYSPQVNTECLLRSFLWFKDFLNRGFSAPQKCVTRC